MDPLSQGLFGSTLAAYFSKKKDVKNAIACGFVGGISPDLDILIKYLLQNSCQGYFGKTNLLTPLAMNLVSDIKYCPIITAQLPGICQY